MKKLCTNIGFLATKRWLLAAVLPLLWAVALIAQPTVFYTSALNVTGVNGTFANSRMPLSTVGGFKQTIFKTSATTADNTAKTWAFHQGTTGAADYSLNWRPYNSGSAVITTNAITAPVGGSNQGALRNTGGGTDGNLPTLTNNNWYVFNIENNSGIDNYIGLIGPLTTAPSIQGTPTHTAGTGTVVLTASLASDANMYVRASADGFVTSGVNQVSMSGTTGTFTLPSVKSAANPATVSYYFFTSNRTLAQLATGVSTFGQRTYDLFAINVITNGGANYSASGVSQNVSIGSTFYGNLGAAFTAISNGTHTGAVAVNVFGNTIETTTATLTATGVNGASYSSVMVTPTGAQTISGNISGHLVDLNAATNTKINGLNASGNSLTITNAGTAGASTIRFINDASGNTITNCTVLGGSTTFGNIYFATGTTTGNDNNTISNCNISAASGVNPLTGITSAGSSTAIDNSGNTVTGCNISDYFVSGTATYGIFLQSTGNSGWTITNNKLFQTATRTCITTGGFYYGISVQTGSGYTISDNTIGFANSSGTGTTNIVGSASPITGFPTSYAVAAGQNTRIIAIICAFTAAGTVSNIQGNTIGGLALYTSSGGSASTGVLCGINVTSGNANIGTTTGNTIGATAGNSSIYAASTTGGASAAVVGIYATSANTVTIQNNKIGAIDAMGTTNGTSGGFTGIDVAGAGVFIIGGSSAANLIGNADANNIRTGYSLTGGNLSNTGTLTSTTGIGTAVGIRSAATGATQSITYNTLRNWTTSSTVQTVTGITTTGTNTTSLNIDNNSISTIAGNSTVTGIALTSATPTLTVSTNAISGLSSTTATATVAGISSASATANINTNTINALSNVGSTSGVTNGIMITAGTTVNVHKNKIYDLLLY